MKVRLSLAAAAMLTSVPIAAGESNPPVTTAELATHELALQGTALALASETFQNLLIGAIAEGLSGPFQCNPDTTGPGSSKIEEVTQVSASTKRVKFTYYFDHACVNPFAALALNFVHHANGYETGSGKITYRSEAGAILGDLSLSLHFLNDTTTSIINLGAIGGYVPKSGAPALHLGVMCRHVERVFAGGVMPCQVAAAQDFPDLGKALGFHANVNQKLSITIKFNSVSSDLVTAPTGSLDVGFAPAWSVALTGTSASFGTTSIQGQVGAFSVFPPTPTAWSVSDTADHQKFATHVVNDTDRNSIGTVTDTMSLSRLATLKVDRSGTGTITYTGKPAAAVSNWVLSK